MQAEQGPTPGPSRTPSPGPAATPGRTVQDLLERGPDGQFKYKVCSIASEGGDSYDALAMFHWKDELKPENAIEVYKYKDLADTSAGQSITRALAIFLYQWSFNERSDRPSPTPRGGGEGHLHVLTRTTMAQHVLEFVKNADAALAEVPAAHAREQLALERLAAVELERNQAMRDAAKERADRKAAEASRDRERAAREDAEVELAQERGARIAAEAELTRALVALAGAEAALSVASEQRNRVLEERDQAIEDREMAVEEKETAENRHAKNASQ